MRVVVQKSLEASCKVDGEEIGRIEKGLVLLTGFTEGDTIETIEWMVRKVLNLRIFEDDSGIMNLSLLDVGGEILSISQFTLYADTKKGNRPSYIQALNGKEAEKLYHLWNQKLSEFVNVSTGKFGADMKIGLVNDGPVTILLER